MISRRKFIKLSIGASGSLLVHIPLPAMASKMLFNGRQYFDAWLEINSENQLKFSLDKVEMGQGVVNSLVAILAEEINTDPLTIKVQLPSVGSSQSNPQYTPGWGTGASSSIRSQWPILREAGAILHRRMVVAAAQRWGTDAAGLVVHQARVVNPVNDASFSFSDLIADVAKLHDTDALVYKAKADYQWVGHKIPARDLEAKITGKALYCSDVKADDLALAVAIRCPYPGGELLSYQWGGAKEPEDIRILIIENTLVLVGYNYHRLNGARDDLSVEWLPKRALPENNQELNQLLLSGLEGEAKTVYSKGVTTFSGAKKDKISATYRVPYLAHATLEAMNCTVLIAEDSWQLWAPTQKPAHALSIAVKISGLPAEKVSVNTGFVGGGFGRRLKQDYVTEACLIAKALGHSVKLVWSREDDFQHGYYRPAIAAHLQAVTGPKGIREFLYRVASSEAEPVVSGDLVASIQRGAAQWWRRFKGEPVLRNQAFDGVHKLPYKIAAQSIECRFLDIGIPTGLWRSVGNSFVGFFIESFIDELARHSLKDPIEYRLELLKDVKLEQVLRRVRKLSSWGEINEAKRSLGVACYQCFGTAVAMVVEVEAADGKLLIPRVWCVIDCGQAIDPDGIRKQVEGAVNFGLCAALFGELKIDGGRVVSSNFDDYPVLRIQHAPAIEVEIVNSDKPPTGVGEPATPLVAPALYNALYALTGERYRALPLQGQLHGQLSL